MQSRIGKSFTRLAMAVILLTSSLVAFLPTGIDTDNSHVAFATSSIDITHIGNYVIFGFNDVRLEMNSTVTSGDIGAKNTGAETHIESNSLMTNSNSALTGDIVTIDKNTTVNDVYYNHLDNRGTIQGSTITPLSVPVVRALPIFPQFTAGSIPVNVPKATILILNAGNYSEVTVGDSATLEFTGGIYNINSLTIGKNSNVLFDTTSQVRVAKEITGDTGDTIGPSIFASIDAKGITFFAGSDVRTGRSSLINANIYSPNGEIRVEQNSKATGAFVGNAVRVEKNSIITLNSVLGANTSAPLDLVLANSDSNNISILLGTGTGSFGPATTHVAGNRPVSAAAGDFNGDGTQDIVVVNQDSNNVSILLADGTGSFGAATNFAVVDTPESVAVSDFNLDGKIDLAVTNDASNNVSILLGDGTGSFGTATNFAVGSHPTPITVGDFNHDGKQDLAVANRVSNNVSILLGDGTGSFGAATNFAVGTTPSSVAVGDFDGDGKQDLAVTNAGSNNVSILLGDGTGSFGAATNFAVGSEPFSVAVSDFNGDGKRDLAVGILGLDRVSILLGDGTGSFGAATNFAVGSGPISIAVGDFNLDGNQDLAVANELSNNVSVLLGKGTGSFGSATNFADGGSNTLSVAAGKFG